MSARMNDEQYAAGLDALADEIHGLLYDSIGETCDAERLNTLANLLAHAAGSATYWSSHAEDIDRFRALNRIREGAECGYQDELETADDVAREDAATEAVLAMNPGARQLN